MRERRSSLHLLDLESLQLIKITVKSRVIKKIGKRGGRTVIFLLRPNYVFWAVEFVLGDKK
jgi:hypothetical protein